MYVCVCVCVSVSVCLCISNSRKNVPIVSVWFLCIIENDSGHTISVTLEIIPLEKL